MSRIGFRNRFYQQPRQPTAQDSPKACTQAANEPRAANEQSPPLDSLKAPQPPSEDSENLGDRLLAAIREIADALESNQISTRNLLLALTKRQGEPWAALWGRDIARGNLQGPAAQLARLLKPFDIIPQTIREPDGSAPKGYKTGQFDELYPLLAQNLPWGRNQRHKAHE